MEGWDGTADGQPSDLTRRRWQHFGDSGAKLIWGGEAVAVQLDGRANPQSARADLERRQAGDRRRCATTLVAAHREALRRQRRRRSLRRPAAHALRPLRAAVGERSQAEPRIAYAHPLLDRRFPAGVHDDERRRSRPAGRSLRRRGEARVATPASRSSTSSTATAISVTSCSARARAPGKYGGSIENRTRFLRNVDRRHPRHGRPASASPSACRRST